MFSSHIYHQIHRLYIEQLSFPPNTQTSEYPDLGMLSSLPFISSRT